MEVKSRIIKALRGKVVPLILVVAVTMAAQALTNVRMAMGVTSVTSGGSAADLATNMTGPGITIVNDGGTQDPTYTGVSRAAGTFSDDGTGGPSIGFDGGIVIGSGDVNDAVGPNISHKTQNSNGVKGDLDLNEALGLTGKNVSRDAAALEFDFIPGGDEVELNFVFGSDEYNALSVHVNEFVILINGQVRSLIDSTLPANLSNIVRISTVNGGKAGTCSNKKDDDGDGDKPAIDSDCQVDCDNIVGEGPVNPGSFINNSTSDGVDCPQPQYDVEADGFTV
ncbi:MAG: choice-of-anchor L domain-containing protein, partial [Thiotrichaceae bacterium]